MKKKFKEISTPPDRDPVEFAVVGSRSVNQLAADKINATERDIEDGYKPSFKMPRWKFPCRVLCSACLVTHTKEQLRNLRNNALGTIGEIAACGKNEDAFETNETRLCSYCDSQKLCQVTKHEFRVNGLPLNKYRNEPGVKLVNTWTKLKAQRDELNEQIAELDEEIYELQDALIEYAEENDASVICGDEHKATIRYTEKAKFPTKSKDQEDHAKMERLLQESPFWDIVSSLDRHALISI